MNRASIDTIVFGCSPSAKEVLEKRKDLKLIAFADNDPRKWYRTYNDKPVIPPQLLSIEESSRILILSQSVYPILEQLITMGVDETRIEFPPRFAHPFSPLAP